MIGKKIPLYPLYEGKEKITSFKIEPIVYVNTYNTQEFHRHNYYEIFMFKEGAGQHHIDFNKHDIKNGSIHFVSPGQIHQVDRAPKSLGFVLMFNSDFFIQQYGEP